MERSRTLLVMDQIKDSKWLPGSLVLLTLTIGIVIGTLISSDVGAARKQPVAPDATPIVIPKAIPIENEFSAVAKKIRPAVVNIQVEFHQKSTQDPSRRNPQEDFFRRFFGTPESPFGEQTPRGRRRRPGEGSGVIVDPKGYIITNNHVVGDADRIRVRLFDDDTKLYEANIIGADAETDIAVLKIEIDHKVPFAFIGNSETVDVGDWAIAVGSPFGYRETVTVGIISAKSREVSAGRPRPFQKFLQTDAAINPGNSGGPLLNIRGEVIGINTAIVSNSGSFQGLGFALPSNVAARVYNQIIQYGKVVRGSIGIEFQSNQSPALLRTFGAPDGGVLVGRVKPGGPADRGGIQKEDVIIKIENQPVTNGDHLIEIISSTPVDSSVSIVVVRNGEHVTLDVEIEDRSELFSEQVKSSQHPKGTRESEIEVMLGFSVTDISRETRERIGYKEPDGVLVTKVTPASFADDIGLLRNDIIVGINRKIVKSVSDIEKIQDDLKPGSDVAVKIVRLTGRDSWSTHYLAGVLRDTKTE